MKQIATLLLLLGSTALFAQEDAYHSNLKSTLQTKYGLSGGSWVFATNEVVNANSTTGGGGVRTGVDVTGLPFTRAARLVISTKPTNPWNAGLARNTVAALKKGDRVLLVFWARYIAGATAKGMGAFTFENNVNFNKDLSFEYRFSTDWKQYILPFEILQDHIATGAKFSVQLGFQVQTVEIGGLTMLNYGQNYPLSALPVQSNEVYEGSAANAPWRVAADARIEQLRKANLTVRVLTDKDQPVPDAQVTVEMLQHEYPFGTAINESFIAGNKSQNNTYQEKLLNLDGKGHGFNELVFENGHKWQGWEGNWGETKANKAKAVQWLTARGVAVRGHTLLWPSWSNSPVDLETNKGNLTYLTNRINDRIAEMLNYPGMKGVVRDWDVINEPTGSVDIANAFKGSSSRYVTGRELYVDFFNKVQQTDPAIKRYVNEAHVTNLYVNEPLFRSMVQELVDGGAKVDGVGFQAHFRYLMAPEEIYAYFDAYQKITGGKVKITEYDNKTIASDSLEASFVRDLLTITFSHPASDGFLMWGFWDGAHYDSRAPLFDINWNLKPAGKPFIDLVFNKWWTPISTQTANAMGNVAVRGFKGKYKITVRRGTQQMVDTVRLNTDLGFTYKLASAPVITATEDPLTSGVKVYPNPAFGTFTVERPGTSDCVIRLLNVSGQTVKTVSSRERKASIPVQELPAGAYIVEVQEAQYTHRQKVIIK